MFKSGLLKQADWCAASRQAQLVVMDIFNAAKIQLGQALISTEGRQIMFSSTEIESLTYIATNLRSLAFQTVTRLGFRVEYILKYLREIKRTIQSLFLTQYPSSAEDQRHKQNITELTQNLEGKNLILLNLCEGYYITRGFYLSNINILLYLFNILLAKFVHKIKEVFYGQVELVVDKSTTAIKNHWITHLKTAV